LRAYTPGKGPLKILGRFSSDVILSGEMRRLQGYRNPLAAEGRYDRGLISQPPNSLAGGLHMTIGNR
jgi:hypothetical protein